MGPESLFIVTLAITVVVLLSRTLAARTGVPTRSFSQGEISAAVMRAVDRWLELDDPDIREVG